MSTINVRKAKRRPRPGDLPEYAYWVYLTCTNCAYTTRMPTLEYRSESHQHICPRCSTVCLARSPDQHERAYTELPYVCRYCLVPHATDAAAHLCETRCKTLRPR